MKKLLLGSLLLIGFISVPPTSHASRIAETSEGSQRWHFYPAVHGGYNKLLEGFDGYEDLGNLGFDFYADPPERNNFGASSLENLLMRISSDWFPLQVPDGTLGLEEDLYALNADLLYRINVKRNHAPSSWNPFVGVGMGIYHDRITLDTPATGKVTGTDNHFGMNLSAGILLPVFSESFPFRLIPEIRYHRIRFASDYVTSMAYQVGLAYWPREKK